MRDHVDTDGFENGLRNILLTSPTWFAVMWYDFGLRRVVAKGGEGEGCPATNAAPDIGGREGKGVEDVRCEC